MAAVAHFDNERRAERNRMGMRAAAERGRFLSRTPFGYLRPPTQDGPSLLPDSATAVLLLLGEAIRDAWKDRVKREAELVATVEGRVAELWCQLRPRSWCMGTRSEGASQ